MQTDITVETLRERYDEEVIQTVLDAAEQRAVTVKLQHVLGAQWEDNLWNFHQAGLIEVQGKGQQTEEGPPKYITSLVLTTAGRELLNNRTL